MEKFIKLIELCKADVTLIVNDHKGIYMSVADYMKEGGETLETMGIEQSVYDEMVKRDIMISLMFYPNTPIGSIHLYHYDVEMIMDEALEIMKQFTDKK